MSVKYLITNGVNPTNREKRVFQGRVKEVRKITANQMALKICDRSSATRADVEGVIDAMMVTVLQAIKDGSIVRLGRLGSMKLSIASGLVETKADWKSDKLKGVRVVFTPGEELRAALQRAKFESAGYSDTVDLSAFRKSDGDESVADDDAYDDADDQE